MAPKTALREQVGALLRLVAAAAGGPLTRRDALWVGPFRPAGRKHTKPWAVGADVAELCLVVLADDGEAGRFPLAGSSLADARTVLAETVHTHVGIELLLDDSLLEIRFGGLETEALQAFAAVLDDEAVAALIAEGDAG